jgi:adenosylcobinamide kinase/adenosylcobinamide-phosphate guanylyltransferase
MSDVTLITGGARSGKSQHALSLARRFASPRAFIATAEPFDDDMCRRIEAHRQERAEDFATCESPLDPAVALGRLPPDVHVAVLDCLTVWLGNLMHHYSEASQFQAQIARLLDVLDHPPCNLIVVTNEVGMGIVPHNDLARRFRDQAGTLNQQVAAKADRVILMVSGYPVVVKGEAQQ